MHKTGGEFATKFKRSSYNILEALLLYAESLYLIKNVSKKGWGGRGVHTAFTSNLYKDIICLKLPQKVAHNGLTQFNLEKMRIVLSRKHAFFFWELVLKGNRAFFLGGRGTWFH